jgi:Ca-activated chloride channel homolog
MVTAIIIASVVLVLASVGEWLHARRVARASRLAFGINPRRLWTYVAPVLRVVGVTALALGGVVLAMFDPRLATPQRDAEFSKRLLICLDVSPSMLVVDAGPNATKVTRARWAIQAVRPLLDSLDTRNDTRISLVAFYTGEPKTILADTADKEVVYNMLDGLELFRMFEPGDTDLQAGVNGALRVAKPWAEGSATLLVISDGDSNAGLTGLRALPPSIAQTIVVGLGDTEKTSEIGSRRTRQDSASLRSLAHRLQGEYVDCNRGSLSPATSTRLSMRAPSPPVTAYQRNVALACVGVGGVIAGVMTPALLRFGRRSAISTSAQPALSGVPA